MFMSIYVSSVRKSSKSVSLEREKPSQILRQSELQSE